MMTSPHTSALDRPDPARTNREETPDPAAAVHGARLERIVDLQLSEQARREREHPPANAPNGDGGPRLEDVAAGGDGHKAGEDAVHEERHVPGLRVEAAVRVSCAGWGLQWG